MTATSPASCAKGIDPERLRVFADLCAKHIDGDEKSEAQIFLEHLF
ncbi:MAG TPA: hypothetical protein PLU30_12820 [Verrucomicrobiae bacterium]|nr:hypothetical protein [Verrucomicrobiae bacterium]